MNILNKDLFFRRLLFVFTWLFMFSCDSKFDSHDGKIELDSTKVIEQSLAYVFKTNKFAPTYYTQPIRIVKSPNVPSNLDFSINGKKCELVSRPTDAVFFKDIWHPVPYVEIEKLKFINIGTAEIDLLFRATGHWFMLTLKRDEKSNWKVEKMEEATI